MERRNLGIITTLLLLFGGIAVFSTAEVHLPGNHQGYEPVQPIAFSHRLHAGEMQIDCRFCHFGADRSRHAGIPPASLCMNCHQHVTASFDAVLEERQRAEADGDEPQRIVSPELRKIYDALGLDQDLRPDPTLEPKPIEWVRVHNLADFVYFDHRPHVARGLSCQQCHGPVQSMDRMRQDSDLSMGWCLDCHRSQPGQRITEALSGSTLDPEVHVSTDCASCHF